MRVLAVLVVLQDLDLHEVRAQHGHLGAALGANARQGRGDGRAEAAEGETGRWTRKYRRVVGARLGGKVRCELRGAVVGELGRVEGGAVEGRLRRGVEVGGEVAGDALALGRQRHVFAVAGAVGGCVSAVARAG